MTNHTHRTPQANLAPLARRADVRDLAKDLPTTFLTALAADHKAIDGKGLPYRGSDLNRLLLAHGLHTRPEARNTGLVLRTWMRKAGGTWVGQGNTYGLSLAEARTIAAGFTGKVAPPEGVRFARGVKVTADAPTEDEAPKVTPEA